MDNGLIELYKEYYTQIIEVQDFERFGIFLQVNDSLLIRQAQIEKIILNRRHIDANAMNELMNRGYLFVSDIGVILKSWDEFLVCRY